MFKKNLQVSDLGEKKLIERIVEKSKDFEFNSNKYLNSYIGDDAALIDFNNNLTNEKNYLVATTDLLIQKHHFPLQMSFFQMGWKAVTVNVSDIAAMGAKPVGILISLAIPPNLALESFEEMIDGILEACNYYKIPLIGGDTNEDDEIIISGTALGKVEQSLAKKKYGFKIGDKLAITGQLGLAALGFELLKEENKEIIEKSIENKKISSDLVDLSIDAALNPKARLNEGIILSKIASSVTDITDGLASELYELFEANKNFNRNNNLGIRVYEDKIANEPLFEEIYDLSKILNKDIFDLIFHIGEDFELLFTFNNDNENSIIDELSKKLNFIIIGEINNYNKVEIEYCDGKVQKLSSKGYEHLSND
ncbi:thiamine-phosphate kinase [Methanobrevibacter arboriphilus]|uniref:Thiamine-monophosphate kinase n=1 Tax=Methanobrevibacter arboriphilus TaxID=39441 RepID=A0ACA8R5F8_METAZ|nr:thiamine-phosphate kinase [Methanobrevibacter arboriphilus]MCC7561833.1 thiamine-phosphate kinase [Methanobrevibacter arboriphilus]BBL62175.1 thiamine-monophosphate kinase [Methanobrevibacter arboriphilus]